MKVLETNSKVKSLYSEIVRVRKFWYLIFQHSQFAVFLLSRLTLNEIFLRSNGFTSVRIYFE